MCSAPFWTFNFLSKLMRAASCVRFCLNPFCREVHDGFLPHEVHDSCLPHDKKDSEKTYTICSSHQIGLEIERPERSTTISFFFYLHDKRFFLVFRQIFSASIFRTGNTLIRFPFQSRTLFMKFPTRANERY